MKRNFLLVSMIAAALMTASCSKDDEKNPVEEQQTEQQTQVKQTRPIVIKAGKKSSVSKVATEDGYTLKFSQTDKLVLTDGTNTYATLDVDEIAEGGTSATFKGDISTNADSKTIYATVGSVLDGVQTSTTSLADVVASNCYLKSEEFEYNANSDQFSVDLYDQNAYLVFNVAEGQKKVELAGTWYTVANQHLYAAIPSGQEISARFFGTKAAESVEAGKIYTIDRTDVVDLGLSVLWCTSNANSPETDQKTWEEAKAMETEVYKLPSADNCRELTGEKKVTGVTVTKSVDNGATFSSAYGSVFFPAAGYDKKVMQKDFDFGHAGYYWSSSPANYLYFQGTGAAMQPDGNEEYKYSVRLVRGL